MLISSSYMYNDDDSMRGIVCVAIDISAQKLIQKELELTNRELIDTQLQLVQSGKLASIGELAAGVAHELNQPLMIIRTKAQLLLKKSEKESLSKDKLENYFGSIEKNTKRMMNIINHLRNFSRQSTSKFVKADINAIIENCFLLIGEQMKLKDIIVKKSLYPDLPQIACDENKLEQVFINILNNAKDTLVEKSERIEESEPYQKMITIITQISLEKENTLEILICDNGCGIPQDKVEHIFDPFVTTKEVGKGTGLGLSISYGIIEEHNGTIRVMKTSSEGTVFRIYLPLEML